MQITAGMIVKSLHNRPFTSRWHDSIYNDVITLRKGSSYMYVFLLCDDSYLIDTTGQNSLYPTRYRSQ